MFKEFGNEFIVIRVLKVFLFGMNKIVSLDFVL